MKRDFRWSFNAAAIDRMEGTLHRKHFNRFIFGVK